MKAMYEGKCMHVIHMGGLNISVNPCIKFRSPFTISVQGNVLCNSSSG